MKRIAIAAGLMLASAWGFVIFAIFATIFTMKAWGMLLHTLAQLGD